MRQNLAEIFDDERCKVGDQRDGDTPRTCLVHAADDGTAPFHNSALYFEALDAAGVRGSRLEIDPKGGHGFGLCQNLERDEEVCAWPDAAAAWALDVLGAGASR